MIILSVLRKNMSDHGMLSSSMMKQSSWLSSFSLGSRSCQLVSCSNLKLREPNMALPRRTTSQSDAQPMASPYVA